MFLSSEFHFCNCCETCIYQMKIFKFWRTYRERKCLLPFFDKGVAPTWQRSRCATVNKHSSAVLVIIFIFYLLSSMKQWGGWKSPSAEGRGQAGKSPKIHQYVSDGSLVWSLTLEPHTAAAPIVSLSHIRWIAAVTKPRVLLLPKERCFT